MADWRPRLVGALLLLAASGSTLLHRHIYEAARHGPPRLEEFAVGLLTFVLASTGVLLLLHGAKLLRPATASARPDARERSRRTSEVRRLLVAGAPEAVLLDSRRGVAMILAYRALDSAAERRAPSATRRPDQAEAAVRRSAVRGGS